MNFRLTFSLLSFVFLNVIAQDKTIILMDTKLPYSYQEYFYSGSGNSLNESKIKELWDKDKRITSVAYTRNGWFVIMSKNSGYGGQIYKLSTTWPKEWISQKWDEGYSITSISKSETQWLVVMSKGGGITVQSWIRRKKEDLANIINEYRNKGYYITDACYDASSWTVVMSKIHKYSSQNYFWANSLDDLKTKVKEYVWDKNRNIQIMEYGGGEFFIIHSKYRLNNARNQEYIHNPSDVSSFVKKKWDSNYEIAYVGGGSLNSTTSTSSPNNNITKSNTKPSSSVSSLTYKRWESKFDKGYTEYVRESDGMITETMHLNCVCLNGICKICAGLGVTGYGIFQTYCSSCGGTAKCSFCGGTGTKVTTYRYRYVDEYYSNGATALHVTSSNSGPSVYRGGTGYAYYTYGNSKPIKDEGSYYSFGGETVYGVKTASFRLSKDYKTLWMGNDEYHLIDKAEYDRIAEITSKALGGSLAIPSSSPSTGSGSYSSGSSSSSSSSRSIYTKCTDCNGTGRCRHCNGTGTSNLSAHTEICVVCNGNGKCKICYGRGKL